MSKSYLIYFIIFFIANTNIILVLADNECKSQPFYENIKEIIQKSIQTETEIHHKAEKIFKNYENYNPKFQKESDLGACKIYAGQKSCCDLKMTELIEQAVFSKLMPIQQRIDAFDQLVVLYVDLMKKYCQKANIMSVIIPDQILANKRIIKFFQLRIQKKQCKISFVKTIAALNRGIMCSICSGSDQKNDYFYNNKLKISPQSAEAFQKEAINSIQCMQDVLSKENINIILQELSNFYIQNNDTCVVKINQKIKSVFNENILSDLDAQGNKKCKATNFFQVNNQCEESLQVQKDIIDKAANNLLILLNQKSLRNLEENENIIIGIGGINAFLPSENDKNIQERVINSIDPKYLTTATQNLKCENHPAIERIKRMIKSSNINNSQLGLQVDQIFQTYKQAKPKSKQKSDLGVCKIYAGQNSCCNKQMADLIDQAAILKIKPIQQQYDIFDKFTQLYYNLMNKECNKTNILDVLPDQILENQMLRNFYKLRINKKLCKVSFGKALAALNRGMMCSICTGSDKLSDFFQNGKIKLSPESVLAYERETTNSIKCMSNIFTVEKLQIILDELNNFYIKNNDQCIIKINSKIKSTFSKNLITPLDKEGNKKCRATNIFSININVIILI
ncbi:transmembrane protein, putative (macronuclear) [Tetrahymena thermophila SB210]|uniref:Transmembrane protein, putative n=1 Tax=Tetrahymena thermophila (strain SB210) TaxID=312017 RepID=I7M9N0_TETTS|nr:transmembrane protein, putative [Tetrahymena thermophila SB210]EAS02147.2 transmembrane protein, putative [Tetrahymena thermophila SB210]|eukprot:XP_001022392.2 transmembrane protein, putative [Tetrahymena thermophila SB210]